MNSKITHIPALSLVFCLIFNGIFAQSFQDIQLSDKVEVIYKKMTLEEKIGQLNLLTPGGAVTGSAVSQNVEEKIINGKVGGIFGIRGADKVGQVQKIAIEKSRLGIPLLIGLDVIHGHRTIFPIPLGISCSWNMDLIEKSAQIAAKEATAEGIMWNFSPMVDIARDPRWGRIAEGAGEDPFLGSKIATALVKGYQGDNLKDPQTMLATVKHFALYGAAEGGRDYAAVDMSRIRMHNEYFPPYKAAIDAGVASVMTSFNTVDYIPVSGSKFLFTDVLRKEWGFKGFVVSDYTSIKEMIPHGMGDFQQVHALALKAGIDMDMAGEGFVNTLKKSVEEGIVSEEQINQACRRILQAKQIAGLFDDPYLYADTTRKDEIFTSEHRAFARELAAETFVLLKNDNKLLPLRKEGKIALIGPLADSRRNMLGTWSVSGDHSKAVTVLEAFEAALNGQADLQYEKGANISDDPVFAKAVNAFGPEIVIDERSSEDMIEEAVKIAKESDVIIAVMGEAADMSGEASSMAEISLQPSQKKLLKELKKLNKPMVLILYNGRPMVINWEYENMDAILEAWCGGTEGANAIADVIFGDKNPSGKLTTSFPVHVGQIPVYHSMLNTGRPFPGGEFRKFLSNYLDIPNEPLIPFGFGLSYSNFRYKSIIISDNILQRGSSLKVAVEVENTSEIDGKEVVQMYIRDVVGSISRPIKELKGFYKIDLKAGESKTVVFEITEELLKFYNSELQFVAEDGQFEVFIGPNSRDVQKVEFELR